MALALGCTVDELMKRISAYEFRQWYIYEQVHGPLGGERLDYAAALIAERITNMLRGKNAKPIPQDTYMATWYKPQEVISEDGHDSQSDDSPWS